MGDCNRNCNCLHRADVWIDGVLGVEVMGLLWLGRMGAMGNHGPWHDDDLGLVGNVSGFRASFVDSDWRGSIDTAINQHTWFR